MPEVWRHLADTDPGRPALTVGADTLTRDELERRTNRLARDLEGRGVRQGALVTIALPNSVAFVETALAVLKLGATPQPVSARLPAHELQAIVALADPVLVVGADAAALPGHAVLPAGHEPSSTVSDAPLPTRVAPYWKAPASGGSTGRPKLIVAATPSEVDDATPAYALPLLLPRDGAVLVPGPLYHNAPFTSAVQALCRGNHVVVMERFDPVETLRLLERHRVGSVLLVPTMMSRIAKLPEAERTRFDLSALRVVFHMASHCPTWLKAAWIDWLGPTRIWELYGGTEMQALTLIRGDEWLERRGSVGRCLVGELRVVDEHGHGVPTGVVGEIVMRPAPGSPDTYFYVGAEPKQLDGWDSLGDLGHLDADGYLYLADRRTDLIVRGGANVYPAEVEAAIDQHPAVHSSAVLGLPDDDLGQRVHAVVHARGALDPDDLVRYLGDRLVAYKVPSSVELVDAPVRGDDGKVRRSALREERLAGTTS